MSKTTFRSKPFHSNSFDNINPNKQGCCEGFILPVVLLVGSSSEKQYMHKHVAVDNSVLFSVFWETQNVWDVSTITVSAIFQVSFNHSRLFPLGCRVRAHSRCELHCSSSFCPRIESVCKCGRLPTNKQTQAYCCFTYCAVGSMYDLIHIHNFPFFLIQGRHHRKLGSIALSDGLSCLWSWF